FHHIFFIWLLFFFTINYFESVQPYNYLKICQKWDYWDNWDNHKVVVIADPQIVDDHTYPDRPYLLQYITRIISDNYMRKNFKLLNQVLQPDSLIFLGDLFDGGREWFNDEKWFQEYTRYNSIFSKKYIERSANIYQNLPGNHDIGWDTTMNKTLNDRFQVFFGESNSLNLIGNHSIITLDTISLSNQQSQSGLNNNSLEFINHYLPSNPYFNNNNYPNILLTHVPFFRDPNKLKCNGPRESKNPFPLVNGIDFQTVLSYELSNQLLNQIKPDLILSGDDHDYCEITHTNPISGKKTKEITVKSFSMNMGIKYPAFQMLSLSNDLAQVDYPRAHQRETFQSNICLMDPPYTMLFSYITIFLSSIIYIFLISFFPAIFS
ncbi:putative lipid phosphatase CDC1, partial [Ascoidea rubescens DSM 1968]